MPSDIATEADLENLRTVKGASPAPFSWIDGEELSRMNTEPPKMVIEKILPAGALTVICAKSKSGKTTLITEFCEAICTGRKALGHYSVERGPVLYWLADDSNVTRFSRAWKELTGGVPVKNFQLCVARQPLYPDGLINLEKAVQQFKPAFVCVDSYTEVRSPTGPKTDFVKAEYQDMRRLSEFANASGAAVALIHHAGKTQRADPFDSIASSFAVGAGADARMVVEKLDGTQRLVRLDGRDLDEFQFVYGRDKDRRLYHVIDGAIARDWQRIYQVARKPDCSSFTTKRAAEMFGLGDRQMRRLLVQWEQLEALTETTRGNYTFQHAVLEATRNVSNVENDTRY
jgi:RecA-family ATPase